MMLRKIAVDHLPGMAIPFTIDDIKDGVVLIHGPNGIGKSSLCRLVSSMLWRARDGWSGPLRASAQWDIDGKTFHVSRIDKNVIWQGGGELGAPPFTPPADHLAGFYYLQVRDLLLEKQEADQKIQEEIVRRIYGGASPAKIAEELFSGKKSELVQASREFGICDRDLQARLFASQLLEEEETRELPKLEAALVAAQTAEREVLLLEKALQLAGYRRELTELKRKLSEDFPSHMEMVDAKDLLFLKDKESERDALLRKKAEAESLHRRASREVAESALRQGVVDAVTMRVYDEKIRDLQRMHEALRRAEDIKSKAGEALALSGAELGGWGPGASSSIGREVSIDELTLLKIERHLEKAQKYLELEAQCLSRESLGTAQPEVCPRERLSAGLRALWGWRAAAELKHSAGQNWLTVVLALCVVAALAALVLIAYGVIAGWASLLLSGAAACIVLVRIMRHAGENSLAKWERDYGASQLGAPAQWSITEVEKAILALEEQLRRTLEAESLREAKVQNERERRRADEIRAQLAVERNQLKESCGIDPGSGDLTLMDVARRIARFRTARQEDEAARRDLEFLLKNYDELVGDCRRFLAAHLGREGADQKELSSLMEELVQASARLQSASVEEKLQAQIVATLQHEDLRRKLDDIRAFWLRFGLEQGDSAWLGQRIDRQTEFNEIRDREKYVAAQIGRLVEELRRNGREDVANCASQEVESRIAQRQDEAATAKDIQNRVDNLRWRIEAARQSHDVESAQLARTQALDKLRELRETRLLHLAGAQLLGSVKAEHDEVSKPEILRKADELFRLFTLQQYELDPQGNDGQLGARETATGEAKVLGALSEATRIQLLLAVRLAFVLGQESAGLRLPMFFDDILATTDPQRFAAIVHVMGTLSAQQPRQIFYLTADPFAIDAIGEHLERGGFRRPQVINLGLVRASSAAVQTEDALIVPPRDMLPAPDGCAPASYGVAIGATAFDPRGHCAEQHLFHMVGDDMQLLHRLLVCGMTFVGQWRSCVESHDDCRILPEEGRRRRLDAAIDTAEAFIAFWQLGRGCRVTHQIIDGSTLAPSAKEKLREICFDLGGHPLKILDLLLKKSDERLKNLKKIGDFVEYLKEACGCHEEERLTLDAITRRVFGCMAVRIEKGDISADDVARMVHELWHKSPQDIL